MPTYNYECPIHGEFEYFHSIKDELHICPKCIEENITPPKNIKRLISGGTSFILLGSGWAKDNYK